MTKQRRDQRIAALVGTSLFAVYVAVSRAQVKSYDGSTMAALATRVLTKHTLTTDPAKDALHLQSPHVSYGFGQTLLALPFDAAQRAVHVGGQGILTLANPAVLAGCGVLLFLIGRELGWARWVCAATAVGFGILTTALWQSTEMFSEPGVALCSLLIVFGVLTWRARPERASLLTGVGVALSILFRPDSLLLVAPLALVAFWYAPKDVVLARPALVRFAIPVVVVGVFQLWYDNYRYGSLFSTGYAQQAHGRGFDTPIGQGLDLLVRSPGRGFFWTAPILLLAIPGMVTLYRRTQPLTIAIALVVAARFLYVAHWWTPAGGVAWGPRLLFPVTALLAIPAGDAVQRVTNWRTRRSRRSAWLGIGALGFASLFVSLLSVLVGYEQYWNRWTHVKPATLAANRSHSYFWSLAHNPIVGNIHLLREGTTIAPIHFRGGADAIGVVAILVGIAAIIAAFLECRDDSPVENAHTDLVDNDRLSLAREHHVVG